ncbi:5-methylcytosine restriction system specificity protein McrC [Paraburkholderia sp.]|uniref:5-methylcytosine restriction system specificity protein McrC n=1 Tax=Paraburkholderia sp. TaxID=1926495 RepID=UPI003C7CF0D4
MIRLEAGREDEPVVYCERDGSWWGGRYVGSLVFEGRRLYIRPRFGEEVLRSWFAGAFNLALAGTEGVNVENDWFVPWLLASVWVRTFVLAARHGLPALKTEVRESGLSLKGRLDVSGTVRMRAAGMHGAASLRKEKSLDNPISAAVVAAYAELSVWLGSPRVKNWLPERVRDLMPHLVAAVGGRPRVPTQNEIDSVRLTPITAGYRELAELSLRIAGRRGFTTDSSNEGRCKGVLLDIAELWELYVLEATRRAWPSCDVIHGTRESSVHALLTNRQGDSLGFLRPDAVVGRNGGTHAVIDAKYKLLRSSWWNPAPQREDMYQMAAYLGRYGDAASPVQGALVYPVDPSGLPEPLVEITNPWRLDDRKEIHFLTLPHQVDEAARKLRQSVLHRQ